jgi:hypothetical protein
MQLELLLVLVGPVALVRVVALAQDPVCLAARFGQGRRQSSARWRLPPPPLSGQLKRRRSRQAQELQLQLRQMVPPSALALYQAVLTKLLWRPSHSPRSTEPRRHRTVGAKRCAPLLQLVVGASTLAALLRPPRLQVARLQTALTVRLSMSPLWSPLIFPRCYSVFLYFPSTSAWACQAAARRGTR